MYLYVLVFNVSNMIRRNNDCRKTSERIPQNIKNY